MMAVSFPQVAGTCRSAVPISGRHASLRSSNPARTAGRRLVCPPLAVTKKELVKKVAEDARVEVKIAEAVVAATFDAIVQYVAEGEKVSIVGFGTYEAKTRSARTGRNPQTGEALQIPEKKAPSFTAGKAFKDKVNCESSDK